jgi:hypothetical protein
VWLRAVSVQLRAVKPTIQEATDKSFLTGQTADRTEYNTSVLQIKSENMCLNKTLL